MSVSRSDRRELVDVSRWVRGHFQDTSCAVAHRQRVVGATLKLKRLQLARSGALARLQVICDRRCFPVQPGTLFLLVAKGVPKHTESPVWRRLWGAAALGPCPTAVGSSENHRVEAGLTLQTCWYQARRPRPGIAAARRCSNSTSTARSQCIERRTRRQLCPCCRHARRAFPPAALSGVATHSVPCANHGGHDARNAASWHGAFGAGPRNPPRLLAH